MIGAVIFDLDGVLVDSEQLWDQARRAVVEERGGRWEPGATEAMQGMSSVEWSGYLQQTLGVDGSPEQIAELVVARLLESYRTDLPLLPGAREAVERLAARWRLALASSSNPVVIESVLDRAGLTDMFQITISSEEVARGKPAPDVYLEATRRLGVTPERCCAIEDSANGIRSALAASMTVVAIPNRDFPPPRGVLARASLVLSSLDELTVDALVAAEDRYRLHVERRLDEEEDESFPASDPHADWAGPPSI
jgi:HAD superfamily hydrolase (TIGR01509 family)